MCGDNGDHLGRVQRERQIEQHLPLVRHIARRFAGLGESVDELVQVGSLAPRSSRETCTCETPSSLPTSAWLRSRK